MKQGIDLCRLREVAFDGSGAPRPPERRITLVNRHAAMVQEVYISGSAEEDWGPDRLGEEVLARGQRREVAARLRDCEADLRIVFEERRAAEERASINLCETPVIVLRPGWTLADRLDEGEAQDSGPRPGSVRLRNAADVPVAELYAYPAGQDRGPDRLGRTVLGVGETLDFAPPDGVGCTAELAEPDAKLRDDRLPGATPVTRWLRCPAGDVTLALLHGEGIAFLGALERLEAACQAGPVQPCIAALVAEADVSGDGRLSAAELARMLRGAAWALGVQQGGDAEGLAIAGGLGGAAALAAARLLVGSLDYDDDGRLSPAELAQDRLAFAPGTGSAQGRPGTIEALAEGAGLLRNLIERLASE